MPDFFNDRMESAPNGWSEAFAALPMETPPADAWTRITRALDAPASRRGAMQRERRMSWMIGLASAAVLTAVAWSPLSLRLQGGIETTRPTMATAEAPGLRGPAAPLRSETISTAPATKPAAEDIRVASSEVSTRAPKSTHRKPARTTRVAAKRPHEESTLPMLAATSEKVQPDTAPLTASTTTEAAVDPLQKLKTQSAQLEALVILARDERVANASSELLSSELDSGIAAVDAALAQPDLADARKQELWQQRVDLLQQLAGVEATSRWLAAQGASNDTALVSVY
ncbi:hypothetical protein [Lysobacter sp. Root494]|uniref:hypothetical protein n=1 Tax=Lysobacter sp. Root494 TaxID=1736549 RepID=UPI0006F30C69|nr:hypothetical protein [Lysobacter sp. Root494]KQY55105.1 hypothetical protein ASD14_02810 [Lysobacter sp. Root494]